MPISPDFDSVFQKNWDINFLQCASNGALNYTDLCNLLQLTAAEHAEMGGISFTDMQAYNQAWVLSRMRIEIDRLPKWRDTITIKTWIITLENSRSTRALEVFIEGKKIISCETYWAVINTQIRRPEPLALPHSHFIKYSENHATTERVKKINVPKTTLFHGNHQVVFSDLDVVNHVNNVKYLEWCLDYLPSRLLLTQTFKSMDLNFLNEMLLGDIGEIHIAKIEQSIIFSILKETKNCFLLEIKV